MRILVVEDDAELRASVAAYLRRSGFAVDEAAHGAAGRFLAAVNDYDAIVLDLRLPDVDGLALCRELRGRGVRARILMATARDAVADRVAGLDGGADDYLVKPYALAELVARLRALLRRPADALPVTLRVEDLALDTGTRRASRAGRAIALTTKEFAVLEVLMRHPGHVVTREQIGTHAWDDNFDPLSNVIDVYVGRLRRKIDAEGEAPLLATVRGAGWRLG
ncbi:response regulator transcription factor [Roseisolibacter sp. H3M3-2]|uniref:response regulator transcription factor n=1 Tax=Roseisolibacter sp. H3M3-2 TaxID=3031323 RepID=UPI0023DA6A50|nr:response regulator transcription factor [Roseisolibacter sp. H3M3-2]MDF1505727.1 response regulator transcription factor [Roseisolibacter sp. H3M3-2]